MWIKRLVGSAVLTLALWTTAPSQADTVTLPFSLQARLAGVDVNFPIAATLNTSAPIAFVARADLTDLVTKIDDIISAAGLHQPPGDYQSFNYNGTLLQVSGNRLWAKYHFRIDPHGAKPTNGSVELYFRPMIDANALRLVAEDGKLNVSNDIARTVVQVLGLDRRLVTEGLGEINGFLASSDARLQLPPELVAANAMLTTARFETTDGRQVLVVEGTLELTMELLKQLINRVRP